MPYSQTPNLRLRPIPELDTCLAFTPATRRLHTLNPSAWLIAALCADPDVDLEAEFTRRANLPPGDAQRQLRTGLDRLCASGVLQWSDPPKEPS